MADKQLFVFDQQDPMRADKFLALQIPDLSRSLLSQWIKSGCVQINGEVISQSKAALKSGDLVQLNYPQTFRSQIAIVPEDRPVAIAFETEQYLIINKERGVVVHPGAGVDSNTLVHHLSYRYPELLHVPNWGLIHRLDKETTGLLLVAKTEKAYQLLNQMMQHRLIKRCYEAIVHGCLAYSRTVETKIARSHHNRLKRAVTLSENAKKAITHLSILKKYDLHTHLKCELETGRTHQIRVHCEYLGHPLVGDKVYYGRTLRRCSLIEGQSLHAKSLSFQCPLSSNLIEVFAPLPEDMKKILLLLEQGEKI